MDDDEIYQSLILDHARRPRNSGELPDATATATGDNPSCGDEICLAVRIESDRVEDVRFTAQACAICTASASLMTLKVKGLAIADARAKATSFNAAVASASEGESLAGDLGVMARAGRFPQRAKCATLPWHALLDALDKSS